MNAPSPQFQGSHVTLNALARNMRAASRDVCGDNGKGSVTDENQETASGGDVNRFYGFLAVKAIPGSRSSRRKLIFLVEGPK